MLYQLKKHGIEEGITAVCSRECPSVLERISSKENIETKNGEKIEFDKSGDWTEVKCKSGVPTQIVPSAIRTYVKNNYPDASIIQIERKRNEYEVKLSNRWEITFDSQMRVIDIDD